LRSPRSIVTEHPGTTRDVVSETLRLGGLTLTLEDTAGIRAGTSDPVEAAGIERSRRSHAEADIVLYVLDATRQLDDDQVADLDTLQEDCSLVVLNKLDLLREEMRAELIGEPRRAQSFLAGLRSASSRAPRSPRGVPACVAVSAATGAGIDGLVEALVQRTRLRRLTLQNDAVVSINQRHRDALLRAREALIEFGLDLAAREPPEILAHDLRGAVLSLEEISGEKFTEEILDSIFSRFCIGK
jgi:tRNA modification GTPase